MERHEITELHYITAIEKVESMLERGLLSHQRAAKVKHRSVALEAIQDKRSRKTVPGGQPLHAYVNLYFNGRNVMMSRVIHDASVDEICLLRVAADVLEGEGVVIADQNAASDYVRFHTVETGLMRIDRETLFAISWKHPEDQIWEWRHTSAMCAEALIPRVVEARFVTGAYVGSKKAEKLLAAVAPSLSCSLDPHKFLL